jgi:hypothetical protein
MTPAPSAARRLSPLGCALIVAVAVALPGCGDGGSATAESTAPPAPQKQARTTATGPGAVCPARLDAFVRSLDSLRRQLAVGLSYDQYTARVKALRAEYEKLPIGRLGLACLATSGTPGERAFDKYVDAANAWGECLADASCETATIEPVLQRKWRLASHALSEAQ